MAGSMEGKAIIIAGSRQEGQTRASARGLHRDNVIVISTRAPDSRNWFRGRVINRDDTDVEFYGSWSDGLYADDVFCEVKAAEARFAVLTRAPLSTGDVLMQQEIRETSVITLVPPSGVPLVEET